MENNEKVRFLEDKARELRRVILTMIHTAKSGHPGGSLSAADLVAALYFNEMNVDPANPKWEKRDRFILSKGHTCPVVYGALAMKGFFDFDTIYTLRKMGSILQGHPDMNKAPGIDMTTGSLGQGLSAGVGMAFGAKLNGSGSRVYVMLGDGEIQEGQIWEAAMLAAKCKLDNLVAIVDFNNLQNDGYCSDIMPMEPVTGKWEAFGWHTLEIDGHNMGQILQSFAQARRIMDKPTCIIARTVKGKGVSFMENICEWHGTPPNDEQYQHAMTEIGKGA